MAKKTTAKKTLKQNIKEYLIKTGITTGTVVVCLGIVSAMISDRATSYSEGRKVYLSNLETDVLAAQSIEAQKMDYDIYQTGLLGDEYEADQEDTSYTTEEFALGPDNIDYGQQVIGDYEAPTTEAVIVNTETGDTGSSGNTGNTGSTGNTGKVTITTDRDGNKVIPVLSMASQFYVYENYDGISATRYNQGKVHQLWYKAGSVYNDDSIATINGYYVIACVTTFGQVGDRVDFYLNNGMVLECIIGDSKGNPGGTDASNNGTFHIGLYGLENGSKLNIIEFVVNQRTISSNPGTGSCFPEIKGTMVTKAINHGSIIK